jgi:hypothetical protein
MRSYVFALAFIGLVSTTGMASAKGCIKGAAVGGVAGHVAGKHGVLGAAAGCAVGRHQANKKEQETAANQQLAGTAPKGGAPVKQQ